MDHAPDPLDRRLAERLRQLRTARGWTLEQLAGSSGVSRAALSRIETGATSPTAQQLGRLAAAHGLGLARLMEAVEPLPPACLQRSNQTLWQDPATGLTRRSVSPPAAGFHGEAAELTLPPGTRITYERPPEPGLEHHLILLDGALSVETGGAAHDLTAGDCLRYRLEGPSAFAAGLDHPARYLLITVRAQP